MIPIMLQAAGFRQHAGMTVHVDLHRRRFVTGCAACASLMKTGIGVAAKPAWESLSGPGFTLHYVGSMREVILQGARAGKLATRELQHLGHPYGLGPVAELQGEVTMIDGRVLVSVVDEQGKVRVQQVPDVSVPFFVWADVEAWSVSRIGTQVSGLKVLADVVREAAGKAGLGDAFPFMVTGKFQMLAYHVIRATPGAPPGMSGHRSMQVPFEIEAAEATLVGFWSNRHQGVFTHADSNVHVHFVAGDYSSAGHIEDLLAGAGAINLHLPARG